MPKKKSKPKTKPTSHPSRMLYIVPALLILAAGVFLLMPGRGRDIPVSSTQKCVSFSESFTPRQGEKQFVSKHLKFLHARNAQYYIENANLFFKVKKNGSIYAQTANSISGSFSADMIIRRLFDTRNKTVDSFGFDIIDESNVIYSYAIVGRGNDYAIRVLDSKGGRPYERIVKDSSFLPDRVRFVRDVKAKTVKVYIDAELVATFKNASIKSMKFGVFANFQVELGVGPNDYQLMRIDSLNVSCL